MSFAPESVSFDPTAWLSDLVQIGGGYALASSRNLWLTVDRCDPDDLAIVMSHVVGRSDRQEAIMSAIEQRSIGQMA